MAKYRIDPGGGGAPGKKGGAKHPFGGGGPPPVAASGTTSHTVDAALKALGAKYHYYAQFIPLIKNAATQWSVDPVQLMMTIIWEGGKANDPNPNNKGAIGLAQFADTNVDQSLNPNRYQEFIQQYGAPSPTSATWSINYMAWRMDGGIRHYPSLDDWYRGTNGDATAPRGYNPGFQGDSRGPGPSALAKTVGGSAAAYTPTIPQSVTQTGGKSASTSAATQGFKDPWVVAQTIKEVGPNGKMTTKLQSLKKVFGDIPPKGTVIFDGLPMRLSDWDHLARQLQPYFVSYTGRRPDANTLYQYVSKGWSTYSLTVALAKNKNFTNSPIWKQNAPAYQDAAKSLLPSGTTAPKGLITSAIVNSWSTGTFQAVLRRAPGYVQSNEFESNVAALQNVHQSIMGVPNQEAVTGIKQAALAGWDANQYANYLRAQPQYQQSPEYQTKTLQFLTQLGLITGQNPVAYKGTSPLPNKNINLEGALPTDPRIKGNDALTNPEDTVVTYGK